MNKKGIHYVFLIFSLLMFTYSPSMAAKKLVSEARSVIQNIQTRSDVLSGELEEYHRSFSKQAANMVELEAAIEDLKRKGYLGKDYADTPEKYDRLYAEYAKSVSELKDIFVKFYPRIQNAVSSFNRSVYVGRDRIEQLRSDDLAIAGAELRSARLNFQTLQQKRIELDNTCPQGNGNMTKSCSRQWTNYQRQLGRLKQSLTRLQYMQKISNLKDSIVNKLSQIMEAYVNKEADTVDMLMNYAFCFEQYSDFIGSKDVGGILRTIEGMKSLEAKLKDFEQFQSGLSIHVADMGNLVDKRLENFMKKSGMDKVESMDDILLGYADQEEEIAKMIRALEKEL
jgi:exonuclease VII large subunit